MTSTMATPVGGTEQSELITVAIDGYSVGVFDTWTGGDAQAANTQYRSGGQLNQSSYQTLVKYTVLTVGRVLNLAVDWELIRRLRPLSGRASGLVSIQPLDADLNIYGKPHVAVGLLLGIKALKGDSHSEAIQTYTIDFSVDSWS